MTKQLATYWRLLRPNQWIKNLFVFSGVLFGNGWRELSWVYGACITVAAFCFISSGMYIFNDIVDRESDKAHPVKRYRPIAHGDISPKAASFTSLVLLAGGFSLGVLVSREVVLILGLYVALNTAYSLLLKQKVIVDVFCISLGFMLRILAGTFGLGIAPSHWLLICGMMVTLFLGFAKRRTEYLVVADNPNEYREVLAKYSREFLDQAIGITATATILTYSLYTMSDYVQEVHHVDNLIGTVPLVAYGVFRYVFLVQLHKVGAHPSRELLQDRHIIVACSTWLLLTLWLIS